MKVFRAGAIYAGANIASAAVPFLLLPLLTRVLAPAEYGHIVAFSLLITFCTPFAGLNLHSAVGVAWFSRPRDQIPVYNGTALLFAIVTTLPVSLIALLAAMAVPSLVAGLPAPWAAVAALTAGANVILQCRLVLWQSQQQPFRNALLQVTASVLNVGLSLVAVLWIGLGASGRNAGIALSAVAMAFVSLVLFTVSRDAVWSIRADYLKQQIRYGLPLIPHVMAGVILSTIDRWMVSTQLGSKMLGIYGAGAQLGMVMTILADAFVKAYNPWLYAKLGSGDASDKLRVVGAIYVAAPAFLCLAAAVDVGLHWTSGLLLGPRYAEAVQMLPWFVLGGAFSGVYFCTSSIYFFRERTGLLASSTVSASAVGAVVVWVLVSTFGMQGAAIGYAATQGILALFATTVAIRSFDLPWFEPRQAIGALFLSADAPNSLETPNLRDRL
ncbi:MAG: oligosaccharide flippase family protein [Proteobacteria bacterium]|nr:oligosaccharide flippase family protein [Pseudomonadota bacterium]